MLTKGVYPFEYIYVIANNSLPEEKDFYSHLNMEDITDVYYAHAKRVYKDDELKHLGDYLN